MASLKTKVQMYAAANGVTDVDFTGQVFLQDDMVGGVSHPYIKEWNIEGVSKPTDEQLATYNTSATTEESNRTAVSNRKAEYGTPRDQIENIIENGLEAEQTRVQTIKDKYPKA